MAGLDGEAALGGAECTRTPALITGAPRNVNLALPVGGSCETRSSSSSSILVSKSISSLTNKLIKNPGEVALVDDEG